MYRMGQGALDQQIADTIAAVRHDAHLAEVDQHLAREAMRLRGRIAELQVGDEVGDGGRLSLGRLWSLLRGGRADKELDASIARADRDIMIATFESELALVSARRTELAAERATVAGAAEHLAELLEQKEAWLAETGAPGSAELLDIARVRGDWLTLEQCLADAFAVAAEAQTQILQALVYFEDAHDPASRYRGTDSHSGSRQGQLQQCSVHAAMADVHCRTLDVELLDVINASRALGLDLPPILTAEPRSVSPLAPADAELRRDGDRIAATVAAITDLRRIIKRRLAELDERRRRLLEG